MVTTVLLCGHFFGKKLSNYWIICFFYGGCLVWIGGSLLWVTDEHTSAAYFYGWSIVIGSGSGAYIQMPFSAAQRYVKSSQIPAVVGLITGAQLAAPAVTLSIANSVFLNQAVAALRPILPPDTPALRVVSGAGSEYLRRLDGAVQARALHAIVESMTKVFLLVLASGVLTVATAAFLIIYVHLRYEDHSGRGRSR